jgi:flagellin
MHTREVFMVDTLSLTANRISSFHKLSSLRLADSLKHIAAGKRILTPSEGIGDFMRAQTIRQDRSGYENLRRGLARGDAMLNVAEGAATTIVNDFKRMKEIVEIYYGGTVDETGRTALEAEFNMLKVDIDSIRDNTYYEGRQLMQGASPLVTLNLSPTDMSKTMKIEFDAADIVDTSAIDLTAGEDAANNAIDTQMSVNYTYVAKVSGFLRGIDSQRNVMTSIISNSTAYESTISNVNDGEEMSRAVAHDIRNQASLSMLMQANVARQSILRLFS